MISIREAGDRVDRRLTAAAGLRPDDAPSSYQTTMDQSLPLACAGSNVSGPDLVTHVRREVGLLLDRVAGGEQLGPLVAGVIVQSFWLGWEHGRAAE